MVVTSDTELEFILDTEEVELRDESWRFLML